MIQHIRESCGLSSIKGDTIILFEDNTAYIAHITRGYIKRDRTKHISPKFFYTHELQKSNEINVQQICSSGNLVKLFTKSLPTSTFKKLIHKIGMCQLKDIDMRGSMFVKCVNILCYFSFRPCFVPLGFTGKDFNEAVLTYQEQLKEL